MATQDDALGDFECGYVLVENGIIKAIGDAEECVVADDVEVIDTTDGVVMPGLVDTHRHTSLSLLRGIAADQSLIRFLSNTFLRWLPATSAEDIHIACLASALEAMEGGVTTVLDCAEAATSKQHAEANLKALRESGIRAYYCYGMGDGEYDGAIAGRSGWASRLAHLDELYKSQQPNGSQLVQVGLQLSHVGSVSFDQTAAEINFARKRDMLCCSHTGPFMNTRMCNGLSELHDHGLMLPGHVYIHCTGLSDHEMGLIAETGGKVSIATETEMQMGMGLPPVRACINHGIKPTLSVDTSSIVSPDLLSQMRLTLQLQRCIDNDLAHKFRRAPIKVDLTTRDVLAWATRNGADAVGMAERIGTLTPGKCADITFISFKRFLTASAFPIGTAILHSTPADVNTVMVGGIIRKRHGHLVGYDLEDIRAKARGGLKRTLTNLQNFRKEMTNEELEQYLFDGEGLTRRNLAQAYKS